MSTAVRFFIFVLLIMFSFSTQADINAIYYDQNGVRYDFFTGTEIETTDANIDFTWGGGEPIAGIPRDDFSVRWEGELEVPADGNYTFRVRGDDGIRIYIDGNLLVNDWSNHGPRNRDSSPVAMLAGQRYTILVEHYERGGGAVAQVSWSGPTTGGFQIIPSAFLFADTSPPEVVSAGYGCSADNISIVFDSNMDQATAETVGNYALDNGATIVSATLESNSRTVTLATSELTADDYLLTINNVENTSGDIIAVDTTVAASFQINGLTATYYDQNNTSGAYFTGFEVARIDPVIDFNWGTGNPATGIGNNRFSVRWEGYVVASATDNFEFRTRSDDGVRLYIDDVLVIDNWTDHGPRYDYSVAIPMVAGRQYKIKMEYYENGGGAVAQLQWQNSSFSWVIIPESQLLGTCGLPTLESAFFSCSANTISVRFSEQLSALTAEQATNYSINRGGTVDTATLAADGRTVTLETSNLGPVDYELTVNNVEDTSGNAIEADSQITASYQTSGLTATYYDQNGSSRAYFTGKTVVQVDDNIDFDWGSGSPITGIGVDDFTVRWEGNLVPPTDGDYTFRSRSDDGFRLYLDDVLIIDRWVDQSAAYATSATLTLVAGQSYKIVAEFYERGGDAVAELEWTGPGFGYDIIAPEYFVSDCNSATGEWQFEESFWNGSSGEVLDASGTGNNATARGFGAGSNPATNYADPARPGNPGTCRYGEFDGVDDYVEVDAGFENKQQSFTITAWINPVNTDRGSRIFADDENNSRGYAFSLGDPGNGRLRFYSRGVSPVSVDTTGSVISTNTWTHVAAVHDVDNKTRTIYVNGVAQRVTGGGFSNTYSGTWGVDTGPASIGGETDSGETTNRFTGAIDEVRFYDRVLDIDEIDTVYQETHACDNLLITDHFDIDHSDNAIFCSPTVITVTAEDSANNTDMSYSQTVTLDTQTGDGNWLLNSGNGTFDNGTGNDGIATYEFSMSDNGVASFLLDRSGASDTDPLSIDIEVTDTLIRDDDLEGPLTFAVSGFTITAAPLDDSTNPIDTSNVLEIETAGEEFTAYIAAYGETETDQVCGIIEAYNGTKSLTLSLSYDDPGTGTESLLTPATDIAFSNGQAELPLRYKDVGAINFTITEGLLTGSSGIFVVKPHHFGIYPDGVPADYDGSNPYRKAGEDFNVTVIAEDFDGDPVKNYGKETSPEGVVLTHTLALPAGGEQGLLTTGTGMVKDAGNDGYFDGTYQFTEVGVITLVAAVEDNEYLDRGNTTTALPVVGRFTPDHFVVENATLAPAIPTGDFTYLGQPFLVSYTLRAEAKDNGAADLTTKNYEGSFAMLPSTDSGITYSAIDGADDLSARLLSSDETFTWDKGVATLTDIPLTLGRLTTPDGPHENTAINISVTDSDTIGSLPTDFQLGMDTEFRYGRVFIPPVYGPEIDAGDKTEIPFTVEYWADPDGDTVFNFVLNTDDGDTEYTTWDLEACTDGSVSCGDITINQTVNPSTIVAGRSLRNIDNAITVNRPGAGNAGDVTVQINVDDWLSFDWDTGTLGDENPGTQINFGLYRGHDRIIYWREVQ